MPELQSRRMLLLGSNSSIEKLTACYEFVFYPISPIFYRPMKKQKDHATLNDYYTHRLALEIIVNSFAFGRRGSVPLVICSWKLSHSGW